VWREGTYDHTADAKRGFSPGESSMNDLDVECAEISTRFTVTVLRPAVISHFEVESRGRLLSFAPVELPEGATMQMKMTLIP
jgi:hypothetical protein